MEEKYCQSCGMPMGTTDEMYGMETDGSKSKDYCKYCYENGRFTADVDINGMMDICVPHMKDSGMTEAEARNMLKQFLPFLKRWKS